MSELLVARRLAIVPTTNCSLNCELCCDFLNGPVARRDIPFESVCRDIDACFELIDHVEWLQFVGGEVFVYKDFPKLINYVHKYEDRFDRLIIESNGTVFPGDDEQKAILSWGGKVSLFISDYGKLSRSRDRFVEFFENNGIDYRLKIYYGENQYFDGWIDNNNPHDLKEPGDVLEVNAKNCSQSRCKNMHCFDGKLYRCSNSCFMQEMGLFPPKKGDFVDLHDDTGRGEKREIIEQFYEYARRSCRYCKFKYQAVLPRYAAAKQLLGVRND